MPIDIRQFHQTFFEESLESLAHMETQLLALESELGGGAGVSPGAQRERFNTIFRGAHSIKGASGTFGFAEIAEFTHVLETALDELRDGRRALTGELIASLIQCSDGLRGMIEAARAGREIDSSTRARLSAALDSLSVAPRAGGRPGPAAAPAPETKRSYDIRFKPHANFFRTGNDPLRVLRELRELGELKVALDRSGLPAFRSLDPESCHLAWNLSLTTAKERGAIDEVFAWVAEDADLAIEAAAEKAPAAETASASDGGARQTSIRVSVPKVDALVDLVGELVITQSMLTRLANRLPADSAPELLAGLSQLERNTRELQESVMSIRMLPIGAVFNRLPRIVRDVSRRLGKKVQLKISGERTELDKTVIERIVDPMVHMVRNCLDHGIEPPAERVSQGKPETATIRLDAYQKGGNVVVEIEDDGQGLQRERIKRRAIEMGLLDPQLEITAEQIAEFIFLPGFSTAEAVSDVSGRGVGMDVVRNNIRSLGGNVEISSKPGKGTRLVIRLPLTLAIVDGLSVTVGGRIFILPIVSIVESVRYAETEVTRPAGGPEVFRLRQQYLPLIRLHGVFGGDARPANDDEGILVIIEADGKKAGLLVDDLLDQQQVVIKSLDAHYQRVEGVAAATILGDGTVALILDVGALTRLSHQAVRPYHGARTPGAEVMMAAHLRPANGAHFARS